MKRTSKIIISALLIGMLLIGIGYAAIQNITLNITGTAQADPSQSNFKVMFSGEPTVSDETYIAAAITDEINGAINVIGLTEKGQTVSATYTVQNVSTDISADLSVSKTNSNTEYFTISSKLEKTSLIAGEATTLTVTVELTKVPITESVDSTIGVQLIAMPVEPGQEGTSEGINGSSQIPETTLALVTNDNIGDYIDLGNDIVGTENTSDDWRIFYKEEDTVYAILADYLPASEVPESAVLDTNVKEYPYSVWSNTDRDTLLNGLKNEDNWSLFINEIGNGAKAMGAPTAELLIKSYNAKNGTELVYTDYPTISGDLYVPYTETINKCDGYWLASPLEGDTASLMNVDYVGHVRASYFLNYTRSIRPVVSLPSSTRVELVDGVWSVEQ